MILCLSFIIKLLDFQDKVKNFMKNKEELEIKVLMAARDSGISSILFRNALAKKFNLSLTESLCLTLLGIGKVSTPTEISRYTGLTTGATTTMLDRLEKRRIIARKSNPKDRRGIIIQIHSEYSNAAQKEVVGIQKAHRDLIASFSEEELEIVFKFLSKFTKNVEKHTEKIGGSK